MPTSAAAPKRKAKKIFDSLEELELVHRAKKGDELAFNSLYAHHSNRLRITINRIVKDEDTSGWLANVALTKVWENLRGWTIRDGKRVKTAGFDEQSKFSTWITRIAINEGLMHLRKQKSEHRDAESTALDAMLSPQGGTNTQQQETGRESQNAIVLAVRDLNLEGVADRQVIGIALKRIPASFREVLVLRYWDGKSLLEIKQHIKRNTGAKVTLPAIKSRLLRGRLILKKQVERIS